MTPEQDAEQRAFVLLEREARTWAECNAGSLTPQERRLWQTRHRIAIERLNALAGALGRSEGTADDE